MLLLMLASRAWAVVWRVPDVVPDLQQALDMAQGSDTVLVAPGIYEGHFRLLDKSLTLASWHLTDGDSSHIVDTVLDGLGTGTVLFVRSAGQRHPVIHGFTVRNGLGDLPSGGNSDVGGGLHLDEHSNATLRWLNFENNSGPWQGAALVARGDWGRLRLEHVHFHGNHTLSGYPTQPCAYIRTTQSVYLSHVSATLAGETDAILHVICDSLIAEHLVLRDQHLIGRGSGSYGALLKFSAGRLARISDVRIEDCSTQHGGLCTFFGRQRLELSGVILRNNSNTGPQDGEQSPFMLEAYGSDSGHISRLELVGNSMPHEGTMFRLGTDSSSVLEDLTLLDNTVGIPDTLTEHGGWNPGSLAELQASSVTGLRVEGNRRIIPALYYTYSPGFTCVGGLVDIEATALTDTLRLGDITIRDNLLEDLDYPMIQESSHKGVGLRIGNFNGQATLLEGCRLNGNRVSRLPLAPGYPFTSVIPSLLDLQGGSFLLKDVQMLHNTIGALNGIVESIRIENLSLVDPGEHGIHLSADEIHMYNVLLQGVDQPPDVLSRMAHVFHAENAGWIRLWNCTLAGNRSQALLAFPGSGEQNAQLRNCSLTGNEVQFLEDTTPGDEEQWLPGDFQDCLLPVWREGVGNRVSGQHGMSGERLLREFRAGSPCIDGGNSSGQWMDREDPGQPGMAAAPSAGSLRTDIGHLGGPLARSLPCVDPLPPATPVRLDVFGNRIRLEWDAVTQSRDGCPLESVDYEVQASDGPLGPWSILARTADTVWSEPRQLTLDRRCYRVVARAADTGRITGGR